MKEYHVILSNKRMLERISEYKSKVTGEALLSRLDQLEELAKTREDNSRFYLPKKFFTDAFPTTTDEATYVCDNVAYGPRDNIREVTYAESV